MTKTTKRLNEPKPTSQRKPEVFLCACVGSDAPEQHAWTNLTKGFVTFVSIEDADLLAAHCWSTSCNRSGTPYAIRNARGDSVLLHRAITGAVGSTQVDHRNHDGLDNTRPNLRPATPAQNSANHRPGKRTSPHIPEGMVLPKGVSYMPNRKTKPFRAIVARKFFGCFATAEEAARAYDKAAVEQWGEYAWLNYRDQPLLAAAE
ncbi:hypothetical protein [Microvirga tunisiensis]|uniref:AP2/ERF domain-containing protein n=1 Tax=Microvirga tunisiensis TaxID=2108360 RepID=A0A5N7MTC4_9HYPH|nr:hypothetical protein [Microvirga tunisiensis]MPR12172.1 hypothetical protein [Microvirga tunisiensis]MPR30118.1 hypothetical protein [Microvirga tunisiensis]